MKRYAFIDVHNTKSTATTLDFSIDPEKLYNYLRFDKWSCNDVFWYSGRIESEKHEKEREKIKALGYKIKDKLTKFYKNTKTFDIKCPKCRHEHKHLSIKKGIPKANCDVELTVDCLEMAGEGVEFLIFTGDGDFKYLIEKLCEKKSKVYLFSTKKPDKWGDYRFSSRYDDLLKESKITFIEIDNLKYRLNKEIEAEAQPSLLEEIDSL
jgi:uncharacterized LabA/DUF88 family protein